MPFLSFIVGFRNRDTERVKLFLDSLKSINSDDYELIFIDYGSDENLSNQIKSLVEQYYFAKYYFFNSRGQNWNRAKCLNYGYRFCKGQYIFTSDIDFLYSKNFISIVKNIASINHAYYFKVGFLTQKQSKNIHHDCNKYQIESYSDENAIGALLISRQMFDEVGGYDEFYEIWGVEDNDLLFRIKMTKNQISFYNSQTIIWHIWHLPVKQADILPEGWLKFLKDYFESKKKSITACNQNFYCKIDSTRPIINNKENINFKIVNVECSEKFLPHLLKNEMLKLKPNDGLALYFNFSSFRTINESRLNKLVSWLNKVFKKVKAPLYVENQNMNLYLSEIHTKKCLQYFIKNNVEMIKDYYLTDNLEKERVYLLKK